MIGTGTTIIIILLFIVVVAGIANAVFFSWKKSPLKKEIFECINCKTLLERNDIKFGLCPKCGAKVKNFKGMFTRGVWGR